jgi:hypothetical protein
VRSRPSHPALPCPALPTSSDLHSTSVLVSSRPKPIRPSATSCGASLIQRVPAEAPEHLRIPRLLARRRRTARHNPTSTVYTAPFPSRPRCLTTHGVITRVFEEVSHFLVFLFPCRSPPTGGPCFAPPGLERGIKLRHSSSSAPVVDVHGAASCCALRLFPIPRARARAQMISLIAYSININNELRRRRHHGEEWTVLPPVPRPPASPYTFHCDTSVACVQAFCASLLDID